MARAPRLCVISGPSGAGKGTLVSLVRERRHDLDLTVSATTRKPREGEIDGVSYHFISEEEFTRRVDAGEFLEWAHVHGHRYGTLKSEVDERMARGHSVILEIDIQGGMNVRKVYPDAVLLFIIPPSAEELERRLRGRGSEREEDIALRLENAKREMAMKDSYDTIIINDSLDVAVGALEAAIDHYETSGGPEEHVSD